MIERSTLDDATIPESNEHFGVGSNGAVAGFSVAALKRGYAKDAPVPDVPDEMDAHMPIDGLFGMAGYL